MEAAIDDLLIILNKQQDLLEDIRSPKSKTSDKIIKSGGTTFGNSSSKLNSSEKGKSKDLAAILVGKFFDESKKREKDTFKRIDTKGTTKPTQALPKGIVGLTKEGSKESKGLFDTILGYLGLGAAFFTKLKPLLGKIFKNVGGFIKRVFGKVFGTFRKIFSKIGDVAKNLWGKIKNSKFFQKMSQYVDDAVKGAKGIFKKLTGSIKGIFRSVGNVVSGMWEKLTTSKAWKFVSETIESAKTVIKDVLESLLGKITGLIDDVGKAMANLASKIPGAKPLTEAGKSVAKKVAEKSSGLFGGAKNLLSKGWEGVKGLASKGAKSVARGAGAVITGAGAVAEMGEEAAKSSIRGLASKAIKTVGGISSMMGKIASPVVKRLPIIGPGIETILSGIDISNMKDEYSKNKITLDQLQEMAGKRVISGIGGLLGSAGGAAIGGLLGSIVPGIGTAIAGFIGAVGGDYAGRFLGDIFSEYILPEKYKKSIGAFVTGTPAPKEEMQDFIIRNDKVYSFSNKDELVGMKTGGAIDSLLSGGGQQSTEYLKKVHEITISYLAQIAKNTRYMATHMNNGGSPSVINNTVPIPMPSGGSSPNIPLDDNRSGFFSSPYSLA